MLKFFSHAPPHMSQPFAIVCRCHGNQVCPQIPSSPVDLGVLIQEWACLPTLLALYFGRWLMSQYVVNFSESLCLALLSCQPAIVLLCLTVELQIWESTFRIMTDWVYAETFLPFPPTSNI